MWNPLDHGEPRFQRSSFLQPVVPPSTEICDAPLYCISVNQEWLPYLAAAAMQLCQPSTWDVSNDADREVALRKATDLLSEIGNAVPCNPTPYLPPGTTNPQQACNIAGYLAFVVIRQAMDRAIASRQQDLSTLNYGMIIIRLIPGIGFIYPAFAGAIIGFLTSITNLNITDFQDAVGDEALWASVTCAIYSAIVADGDVTTANFPTIQANLCALTYTHTNVIDAICNWVQSLGAQNLMQAQQPGVMASYTCTCTGTPGIVPPSSQLPQFSDSGTGRVLIAAGQAIGQLLITFAQPFGTTPIVIPGTQDPIMLPSAASVAPSTFLLTAQASRPVDVDTYVDVDWTAQAPGPS